LTIEETRSYVFTRDQGLCVNCGRPIYLGQPQVAHLIPQRKSMVRRYGTAVIHHPLNLAAVCSLECNDGVSLSNHPVAERELVERIRKALSKNI
jgi:5-methylcytosine-specific restriction endonuclease McrA